VTTVERDALHRVRQVNTPQCPGYPAFSVSVTRDEFGRTTTLQDANGVSTFGFDDLNRLVAASPAVGRAATYQYLKDTTLQRWSPRVTLAGIGSWELREDGKGRIAQVLNPFGQLTTRCFDPDSKLLRETRSNGTYSDYTYTARDWLAAIQHRFAGGAPLDT